MANYTINNGAAAKKSRLTLSMVVKNEANRYLSRMLTHARMYIDNAVIIDDGSTDGTPALCQQLLEGIPLKLVENTVSKFSNEYTLRKQQWEETAATHPDWILLLDADEIFEDRFAYEVKSLLTNPHCDVYYFRLYDFWDETHYREDALWCAHLFYRPFMLRYKPDFAYTFNQTRQHCGRTPNNIFSLPYCLSQLRLKHFGWASPDDRAAKYQRYQLLDPDGAYGSSAQYESILDENVHLLEWQE